MEGRLHLVKGTEKEGIEVQDHIIETVVLS